MSGEPDIRIPIRFPEKKAQVQIFEAETQKGAPALMSKVNTWLNTNAHRINVHNVQFASTLNQYIVFVWYGEKFQTNVMEEEE